MIYDFLVDTYATERVKIISTWSEFRDEDMHRRPTEIVADAACRNRWCINA
jgi:hypothetical protein